MKRKICVWLLMMAFMAWLSPAYAETPEPKPVNLTLEEALKIAAKKNPDVMAAGFRMEASEAGVSQARSGFMPRIDFVETFNRTTNPMWAFGAKLNQETITMMDFDPEMLNDPDPINNFSSALTMSWPVFAGGKIYNSFKQAKKHSEAESLMFKRATQEVLAKTATAYVDMMLARENLKVVNQSIASAEANLKMVKSRFDSGFAVKSDFLRAQVLLSDLEQQRLQAESQVKIAQAGLNAAMGSSVDTPLNLTSSFEKCCVLSGSINDWIEIALSTRPDLKHIRCFEDMAKQEVAISKADHYPSLQLVGTYEINSESYDETANSYAVGAVMSMNLFKGFGISSRTRSAKASLSEAQQYIKSMELGVRVQTRQAFLEAQSSWQRIQVAKSALDQADEGLRIVKNRYQTGLLTIVSLLDAELANQQAKMSYSKALHDYKAAMVKLELAAGTIDENSKYETKD